MGCSCSSGSTYTAPIWSVTGGDGSTASYSSEVEAAAAAERTGGTYRRIN